VIVSWFSAAIEAMLFRIVSAIDLCSFCGSDLGSVPEIFPELVPFVLRNPSCFTLDIGMLADGFISTGTVRPTP
jgi:hypothetical protein